ncbi:hypothetical protein EGM88_15250 [Aureibaculum marinum]|uniref:Uncharacterized protein n=1 Tax=Aureibaculum marinum TaxID=2487930 RepID=A0A3N4NB67_9FLAO|nr:hypothetical protein [Aureibaculum marinum]RPD90706.1 hypothetical protein EGM88_15250 [Aureibaculum marinum]
MTGTLDQIIAITSFGNEYLKKGQLTDFYPQNSTFQYCDFVDFREINKNNIFNSKKEIIVSKNPIEWFDYLKSENCLKLRLYYQTVKEDDYKMAGFVGGGGNWFIETMYTNHSDLWISRWNHDKNLAEKPWQVTYGKVIEKNSIINQQLDINEIREKLKTCLEKISEFANQHATENWGQIFDKAQETLDNKNPESGFYHNDLIILDNYDLQNRQLLMSASKAFVFGGMGSWNDMWFDKKEVEEEYNRLSSELYDLIMKSITCAINKDRTE